MRAAAALVAIVSAALGLGPGPGPEASQAGRSPAQQTPQHNRTAETKHKNQPHIIFILIDDQGFNDIGYHNPTIKTPTLDKLAAEGVRLENYYVQPICTPSRSQLITGRYQIHTGLQHSIIRPSQPSCLPAHMDTLPQRLQEAGYATHMVGKWHLGFYRKACLPTRKGFDTFFGSLTGSVDYYSYGSCDGPGVCGYDLHDDEGVAWGHEGKYSTTLFTQRARKILESHEPAKRPLFLLLSLQAVHTPLQPPKSYIYPYRHMANVARRKFAAMVSTVDESVRNLTYALRKYGYYRNSVIVYSTDNGAQPFTGGSNWPLRGRKGTYWEGGVRGVAWVHSPLLKRRRRISRDLLHITDWFPTLVGLAGGNISQSRGLDGFDVWPTISEGAESPRQEILHNIDPLHKATPQAKTKGDVHVAATKPPSLKKPKKKKKKKKKKKLDLRLQPQQKSAFKPKYNKKPQSHGAVKTKSKPLTELKRKALPPKSSLNPRIKSKLFFQSALNLTTPPTSARRTAKRRAGPKFKRAASQSPNRLGPFLPKTATPLRLRPRRTLSAFHNVSRQEEPLAAPGPTPQGPDPDPDPDPALWDTTVQAAIRVGDWKLLTGDPGHGDWVPLQVLPTLAGRWWNLERAFWPAHKNVWLFNISADPYERRDLSERRPEVVRRLLARLAFYNRSAVPVYFPPDDPEAHPDRHDGAWVPWVPEDQGQGQGGQEDKYRGVYKKGRAAAKKKRKKKKGRLHKLKAFFLKLNTRMMSNRI